MFLFVAYRTKQDAGEMDFADVNILDDLRAVLQSLAAERT